jgi:hypothetical protein
MPPLLKYIEHRELRAPRGHGEAVVDPPLAESGGVLAANRALRSEYCFDFHGRCLSHLAVEARAELLAEARAWTAGYRDLPALPDDAAAPLLMAGHQPQLFHPGVWFKNFALDALARRHGGLGVNLVVDNDTMKSSALWVPGGSVQQPRAVALSMDQPASQVPYEERSIIDRTLFAGFGRRAADQIAPLVRDPLIESYWPAVVARMEAGAKLGECLAQARHQGEGRWGSTTLEVPVSRVCRTPSFRWFLVHMLLELPRLRTVYNRVVHAYRRANHIRSIAHPVPDLAAEGPWIEAPFWIWSREDPRRRHLFACRRAGTLRLTDRRGLERELPLGADDDPGPAVARLEELEQEGVKVRSRALITTLWSRLVLSDLFLHGIGGGKYDQVTDALIAEFFELEPLRFLVVSATLHLPVAHRTTTADDLRAVQQRLRELAWHPELYVQESAGTLPDPAELIAAKRAWIRTEPTPQDALRRFGEIRRINELLQPYVEADRRRLQKDRDRTAQSLRDEAVLGWREYAFCLFPEKTLREVFDRLLVG